jgi:hypothetical protein
MSLGVHKSLYQISPNNADIQDRSLRNKKHSEIFFDDIENVRIPVHQGW